MVQVWAENLASLPSYPSTTLASLGRAGCPQDRSASLHILTSFHILIYSVNKELSQQWSSLSGVGGSESDPQPLWIHWIYSSGCVFSPDVYLMEEITSLQSASNSNEAEPDWGDIWTENTGDRMTESLFFSFLFCPFSFFLSFLLPSSLPPSLPSLSLCLCLSLLLSRYSYQSPSMENTEFLLPRWQCAEVDFSTLWRGLNGTVW